MNERIPVAGPSITEREVELVLDAARNGWYGNANAFQSRFEHEFAEWVGVAHAISLPSCTAGIHLALAALGVGEGDEVIVPDITWIASAAPISYVGARPVFADVERASWCLDPRAFESLITPRTKAVIPVDLYGNMANLPEICAIAERNGVAVIEDAAEAAGATIGGRRAGSFGDAAVFSFHGSKTLTTGEGGMLVTNRRDLFERASVLRDHGRRPGDKLFYNREVAFKYKMTALQAALGIAQLERIDELLEHKRRTFGWYRDRLPGITLNEPIPGSASVYWMVTAIVEGIGKDVMQEELAARGIDSRPFFHPLSSLPAYENEPDVARAREANRVSYALSPYGINLPSALSLDEAAVDRVCREFLEIVRGAA